MSITNSAPLQLSADNIDDILYAVRVDDRDELDQTLQQLSQQFQRTPGDILLRCIDPESGNSPVHFAAANGLDDLTVLLLKTLGLETTADSTERNTFINLGNKQGNTALHWAALNGHVEVVKTLIGAGANMWTKNSAGHLALFEAERAEKSEVVQYLLQAGGKEVERTGIEAEEDGGIVQDSENTS